METNRYTKRQTNRRYEGGFTGDRVNRRTRPDDLSRAQVAAVLAAIGHEAVLAQREGNLEVLHDRLEDSRFYRESLGRMPARMI